VRSVEAVGGVGGRRRRRQPVGIDYSSLSKFPKRLPEKLKQIRERAGLTPQEFAPHVQAQGKAVEKYEKGKGDLRLSVDALLETE
jgi:DNA-binding transcriptional regulator YiaG